MSVSADPGHFFQTTSSIEEIERKKRKAANTAGNPLKFSTKLLSVNVDIGFDPSGDAVFVAEAGGTVSGVKLSTAEVSRTGKGSPAPLTCLAYRTVKLNQETTTVQHDIYAGGWDKTITRYRFAVDLSSTNQGGEAGGQRGLLVDQSSFVAHSDFVKCLLVVQTPDKLPILVSGGADGEVNFWDLSDNSNSSPKRIGTINPQARGIESLVLDPYSDPATPTIFISTSQRDILTVNLPATLSSTTSNTLLSTLTTTPFLQKAHDTSVYKLHFDSQGDIWTASADKTSKHLMRDNSWIPETTLQHPDFVRDVLTHPRLPYVITACRDENIRVWNATTSELYHVFSGHYEEITGLALSRSTLISVSIDTTLRTWSLDPQDLKVAVEKAQHPNLLDDVPEPDTKMDDLGLTAEEEAELRAMMEEQEAESLEKMAGDLQ